jgi:Homeodomain-like domain
MIRGRKSSVLKVASQDRPILEGIARSRRLPSFEVDRARIILDVSQGKSIEDLASLMRCHRVTIWRVCRRYDEGGLNRLLIPT